VDMGNNGVRIKNQCKPKGLNKLFIDDFKIKIELNARLLHSNYKEGFNLNTLDQLNYELNNKCGIKLDQDYIKGTKVNLVHVKNDIKVDPNELMNELMLIEQSSKYRKVKRENSITYECKNKGEKSGTRIYGKYQEMNDNKTKYKDLGIDLDYFKELTRIESFFNGWRTVGKHFGKDRILLDILNQTNVNYITIMNILKNQPTEVPNADLSTFTTLSEIKEYGMFKLLYEQCNGNIEGIKNEVKMRLGKNTKATYQLKNLDRLLPMIRQPEGKILGSVIKAKEALKDNSRFSSSFNKLN
jgi:hypothetical protein